MSRQGVAPDLGEESMGIVGSGTLPSGTVTFLLALAHPVAPADPSRFPRQLSDRVVTQSGRLPQGELAGMGELPYRRLVGINSTLRRTNAAVVLDFVLRDSASTDRGPDGNTTG